VCQHLTAEKTRLLFFKLAQRILLYTKGNTNKPRVRKYLFPPLLALGVAAMLDVKVITLDL
jgi:hypothetical protein